MLVLFTGLVSLLIQSLMSSPGAQAVSVFELEIPDLQVVAAASSETTIPSSSVNQLFVHVLKPAADRIDYGSIAVNLNGQPTAPVAEIVNGLRGKLVKVDLKRLPAYKLVTGKNTVEILAENRLGRQYYASFIIKTANESWNADFPYEVQQPPEAIKEIPPQLVLLEPEGPIEFQPNLTSMPVKISGLASGSSPIVRVSVDGKNVALKRQQKTTSRQLARIAESERSVAFDTIAKINTTATQIVVEAEDKLGSRVRITIPVFVGDKRTVVPVKGKKYALIIGISKYRNNSRGVPNLEYADVDARAIYQFLQTPAAGSFSPENMLLLSNEQATLSRIREVLTNFTAKASPNDLLLIFFAGHGAPDRLAPQNLYLIAHDTDADRMADTGLSMTKLRRYFDENIKSKRVVLLMDACHSAGLSTQGTRDLGNNLANQYLEKLLYREEGWAIITSSDVNEKSLESEKWGHGVFTYYLLDGLKGGADMNRDRVVSVGELFRYVRQKVRMDTDFQQNPRMLAGENENLSLAIAR